VGFHLPPSKGGCITVLFFFTSADSKFYYVFLIFLIFHLLVYKKQRIFQKKKMDCRKRQIENWKKITIFVCCTDNTLSYHSGRNFYRSRFAIVLVFPYFPIENSGENQYYCKTRSVEVAPWIIYFRFFNFKFFLISPFEFFFIKPIVTLVHLLYIDRIRDIYGRF